jgi:5-deoxy-glucuronate isomerase
VIRELATPSEQTEYIRLDLVTLAEEEAWAVASSLETVVVVLSGRVDVKVDDQPLGTAGGRRDVFEGPGHAVYTPPNTSIRIVPVGAPTELAVVSAAPGSDPVGPPRLIAPSDQRLAEVGAGNWARTVRTILGPEHAASRLLIGETINPPGNWSSYPPHKHDVQAPPEEVRLEEVYLFKLNPPGGFGVQVAYDDKGKDEAMLVRNDDVAVISTGYHPVVAAPGYALYYLWMMAGPGREMAPHFDSRHAWVQEDR